MITALHCTAQAACHYQNTSLHRWLDYRVHDAWYWTVMRYAVFIVSWMILGYVARYWHASAHAVDRWRLVFFALFAIYSTVQELEQLDQPVLIWRAPGLLLMSLAAVGIIRTRNRPTRVPPTQEATAR